mmetsp:Transcript_4044/g.13331  ORF Transcript_4044/g.13331 Transcript_4044/m.13331 type:complete len:246 (-) Transcript_4044:3367-4104(-)
MTSPPMVKSDDDVSDGGSCVAVPGRPGELPTQGPRQKALPGREMPGLPRLPGWSALDGKLLHAARRPGHAAALKGRELEPNAVLGAEWAKAVVGREPPRPPHALPNVARPSAAMSNTRGTSACLIASVTNRTSRRCCSSTSSSGPSADRGDGSGLLPDARPSVPCSTSSSSSTVRLGSMRSTRVRRPPGASHTGLPRSVSSCREGSIRSHSTDSISPMALPSRSSACSSSSVVSGESCEMWLKAR